MYNSYVKPVFTYNSSAWAGNKNVEAKIDVFHRKQLTRLMVIYYPSRISDKELYKRTNSIPLSVEIAGARWRILGHFLRRPDRPAFQTMKRYYATSNKKKFSGRPLTTLPQTLKEDVKFIPKMKLENSEDFETIFLLAQQKCSWRRIVKSYPGETQSTIRLEQLDGDIIIIYKKGENYELIISNKNIYC